MGEHDVPVSRIDAKSLDYLRVLDDLDGEATTRDITRRTGMDNNQVHYRHRKLEDLGLVEVARPGSYVTEEHGMALTRSDGTPNIARLTNKGEHAIENGLLEGAMGRDADIEHLSQRFDGFRGRMNRRFDELEGQLQTLENMVPSPNQKDQKSQ